MRFPSRRLTAAVKEFESTVCVLIDSDVSGPAAAATASALPVRVAGSFESANASVSKSDSRRDAELAVTTPSRTGTQ